MLRRCSFVSLLSLLSAACSASTPALEPLQTTPNTDRTLPRLHSAATGLPDQWFTGRWQVEGLDCTLEIVRRETPGSPGAIKSSGCSGVWGSTLSWEDAPHTPGLFSIQSANRTLVWQARLIQPTAIAGLDSAGTLTRLYWAEEGSHPGWVQFPRDPNP